MLFEVFLFVGFATATRVCYEAPEKLLIPACTNACLGSDTSALDGVCADNLKGICELEWGVVSFFHVYTTCLSQSCPATTERKKFVGVFQKQCGWFNSITDAQARYFGDWQVYLYRPSTTLQEATSTKTQRSTPNARSTSTQIGGGVPVSLAVSTEQSTSTQATPYMTATTSSFTETVPDEEAPSTVPDDEYATTVLSDELSSTSQKSRIIQTSSATAAHKPTSSASDNSEPVLSTAAIAGIAVGGTCLLTIAFAAVFLMLRRQKRKQPDEPRSMSPPIDRPDTGKVAYEKVELAGREVEPQSPMSGVDVPVDVVELDGSAPVSPVWVPTHTSASERKARIAQNS